ncbi:hypothetical protein GQ85_35030, partial [Rhodococcus rhodochrous]
MAGAVPVDVRDGRVEVVDDGERDVEAQVLLRPVRLGGRLEAGQVTVHGDAVVLQHLQQPGYGGVGDGLVHQNRLGGVAHAGPAGLGVDDDLLGHVQIGRRVHVHVAVAHARLDGGHGGVADDGGDQAGTAARDDDVDESACLDEVRDRGAVRAGQQLYGVLRQLLHREGAAQGLDEGGVEWAADDDPRSRAALPDLRAKPKASTVTFGRASYTIPTTPSGTRICRISRPLGRVEPRTTSPIGSGSPATCRSPAAMPSTRACVSRSRSSRDSSVPAARAVSMSSAFAASTAS